MNFYNVEIQNADKQLFEIRKSKIMPSFCTRKCSKSWSSLIHFNAMRWIFIWTVLISSKYSLIFWSLSFYSSAFHFRKLVKMVILVIASRHQVTEIVFYHQASYPITLFRCSFCTVHLIWYQNVGIFAEKWKQKSVK